MFELSRLAQIAPPRAALQGPQVPPPAFEQPTLQQPLPPAPPSRKKGSLFDKDHRSDTLLAIGTGMLSGFNFGDGMAAAGQNVMGLNKQLRAENNPKAEVGGPDDAFEITTDPRTGERTIKPITEFQDYLEGKRTKQKDVADINGRAMYSLQQLPAEQRPGAYRQMIANPAHYGIDPRTMPAEYDPLYAQTAAGMGQTVAQATSAARASLAQENLQDYRQDIQEDRRVRTGIYRDRAAATTRQGDARLGQGAARLDLSRQKAAAPRGAGSRGGRRSGGKLHSSNSDLSYLQ